MKPIPNETFQVGRVISNPFEDDEYTQGPCVSNSIQPAQTSVEMNASITLEEQDNYARQQEQFMVGNEDPTNPFGNPFIDQNSLPLQSLDPSLI